MAEHEGRAAELTPAERDALGEKADPTVGALGVRTAAELKTEQRADRASETGWRRTNPDWRDRTDLARFIDEGIASDRRAFEEWFDSLTHNEFMRFWNDQSTKTHRGARDVIADRVRSYSNEQARQDAMLANDPKAGGYHEWHMVAELPTFKKWGVSMSDIRELRTLAQRTVGKDFQHVSIEGPGHGPLHQELREMIKRHEAAPDGYKRFLRQLNDWADQKLGGREHLPKGMRLRMAD